MRQTNKLPKTTTYLKKLINERKGDKSLKEYCSDCKLSYPAFIGWTNGRVTSDSWIYKLASVLELTDEENERVWELYREDMQPTQLDMIKTPYERVRDIFYSIEDKINIMDVAMKELKEQILREDDIEKIKLCSILKDLSAEKDLSYVVFGTILNMLGDKL